MLESARKNKGLTQKQLSKLSGISQSYISKLEDSYFIHSPTITQIITLSRALDIDPLELADYFIKKEINSIKSI